MHAALRPYVTTGIAIVGAGVIVAAPVLVPPPDRPSVEIAAVDAVKSVTVDIESRALVEALIAAIAQMPATTAQFILETVPTAVLNSIASGRFANLIAVAADLAAAAPSVPFVPLIVALATELPPPLGTLDGVVAQSVFLANALPNLLVDLIATVTNVIDGVSSPADLPAAVVGTVTTHLADMVTTIQTILDALGGALPIGVLEAPAGVAAAGPQALIAPADLGSLPGALVGALVEAVTGTIALYTTDIPTDFLSLIAAGQFAHLPALFALQIPQSVVLRPISPFLQALTTELPMPLGTPDGLITQLATLAVEVPIGSALVISDLLASVVDSGLSPADAISGSVQVVSTALTASVDAVRKIFAAVGGSIPVSVATAPEGVVETRQQTFSMAAESGPSPLDGPNVVPSSANSIDITPSIDAVTVTVDPSPITDTDDAAEGTGPKGTGISENEGKDGSDDPPDDDVTPNGGADLSDGNMTQPGTTGDDSAGNGDDDRQTGVEKNITPGGASGDDTGTASDNTDSGSGDASDDDGGPAE